MDPVSVKMDLIPRDKVPEAAAAALEREGIARIGGMMDSQPVSTITNSIVCFLFESSLMLKR